MADPNVLVIDDEPPVREAVAEDLKREGYNLLFAENGREGLALVERYVPTVIILDLRMPVMDGLEFLSRIKVKTSDPYSVIVLTGHGNAEDVKRCYEAGVSIFLKKPFNLYEVRGAVKNAMATKQLTIHLDEMVQEQTGVLEQRVREVTALNRLFQQQLTQRARVFAEHNEVLTKLQLLGQELGGLAQRSQALPSLEVLPTLALDERFAAFEAHSELLEDLRRIARQTSALGRRAQLLPRLEDLAGFELGDGGDGD